jgi:hypothetical protein
MSVFRITAEKQIASRAEEFGIVNAVRTFLQVGLR